MRLTQTLTQGAALTTLRAGTEGQEPFAAQLTDSTIKTQGPDDEKIEI